MALLDREKLLAKEELSVEKVMLNKKDFVYVRQMTGRERDRFEQSLLKEVKDAKGNLEYERSLDDFRAKLVVNTVCDENGVNLLQPEDYPTLSQMMSARTLEKIVNVAQRLNQISEEDREALVKN
jgi:hypothetical protein